MKPRIYTAFASAILLAASAFGQSPEAGYTRPSPAQMVAHKVAHLTTLLSLDSTQEASATTIFTTEQTAESNLRTGMRTARTVLKTAVEANDSAGIANAATQIGTVTTQETIARATAEAAFNAILSADQKTKFAQLPGGRFGGFDRFHGGHGGPY